MTDLLDLLKDLNRDGHYACLYYDTDSDEWAVYLRIADSFEDYEFIYPLDQLVTRVRMWWKERQDEMGT